MFSNKCLTFLILAVCETVYCNVEVGGKNDTFFYFAYGSNLLKKRIHINNPTAHFYSTALLKNYRLDFDTMAETHWRGAVATIVEDNNHTVWGDLWTLNVDQMANLDKQEGVDQGWYYAKNVSVTTPDNRIITARTYELVNNPPPLDPNKEVPFRRLPSVTYLEVVALGAIESGLPADYIAYIFSFANNKKVATTDLRAQLGYPF